MKSVLFLLPCLIGLFSPAYANAQESVPPAAGANEREYIYGAELMTPRERDAYRRGLGAEQGDDARHQFRQRHRDRLQQRAHRKGVELDEKGIIRHDGDAR